MNVSFISAVDIAAMTFEPENLGQILSRNRVTVVNVHLLSQMVFLTVFGLCLWCLYLLFLDSTVLTIKQVFKVFYVDCFCYDRQRVVQTFLYSFFVLFIF